MIYNCVGYYELRLSLNPHLWTNLGQLWTPGLVYKGIPSLVSYLRLCCAIILIFLNIVCLLIWMLALMSCGRLYTWPFTAPSSDWTRGCCAGTGGSRSSCFRESRCPARAEGSVSPVGPSAQRFAPSPTRRGWQLGWPHCGFHNPVVELFSV